MKVGDLARVQTWGTEELGIVVEKSSQQCCYFTIIMLESGNEVQRYQEDVEGISESR